MMAVVNCDFAFGAEPGKPNLRTSVLVNERECDASLGVARGSPRVAAGRSRLVRAREREKKSWAGVE